MSTLIPKTETVKLAFVTAMIDKGGLTEKQAEAQFDAWLAEVKEESRADGYGAGREDGFDAGLESAEFNS